jgi:transcriptional regulator with PAS, ATPase and Fis domain
VKPSSGSVAQGFAERLVHACPAPALVLTDGQLRAVNSAASRLLDIFPPWPSPAEVLGVGWRELQSVAVDGDSDLVVDLPPRLAFGRRRGWRLRIEKLDPAEAPGLVVFLEPPAEGTFPRPGERGVEGFGAIFGNDPMLLANKEAAARFARTRLPILLLAETGTGKELMARAIHSASPRRDRPFVAINCGALSPHLLESELFGYAPGAFTGASRDGNNGKIGAARGGTLLLDEVAEMPGPLQALLLRVLEDGTYYRVGDNVPRQADIRLICATCRDLPAMVAEGAFRQDLFFRIEGACLTLPPLRERSDLLELTHHLLSAVAHDEMKWLELSGPPRLSSVALSWILRQPWPGNVRQLKTALLHALVLAGDTEIGLEHLPQRLDARPGIEAATEASPAPDVNVSTPRPTPRAVDEDPASLADIEAGIMRRAVEAADGNLSLAARRLGIARTTLYRHLRRPADAS